MAQVVRLPKAAKSLLGGTRDISKKSKNGSPTQIFYLEKLEHLTMKASQTTVMALGLIHQMTTTTAPSNSITSSAMGAVVSSRQVTALS